MSAHPLDTVVWDALGGVQRRFAVSNDRARRFHPDIGPIAAIADSEDASWNSLAALKMPDGRLILLEPEMPVPGGGLVLEKARAAVQMIAPALAPQRAHAFDVVELTEADVPEMVALAALTQPGPFGTRTHTLGQFVGVKIDGRLAAMAGERMRIEGFSELSGVCTHPDFQGRGLAAALSLHVGHRLARRGETPFLHAYADNEPAIALYRRLGFAVRKDYVIAVLM